MDIAYLGPNGTFTHFAAQQALQFDEWQDATLVERQSLDQLFDGLKNQEFDAIFTPIENSIEGPVNRVLDNLIHICYFFASININNPDLGNNRLSNVRGQNFLANMIKIP